MGKKARKSSIIAKLVIGIVTLTLIMLFCLGGIIFFRITRLNTEQFNDKLQNTIKMTDTVLSTYFRNIETSANLFSEMDLIRKNDESITSYINLSDPSGKVPMKPLEASPYEADVYKMARSFVQEKPELLGVSLALQSNGAFVRFPEVARSNGYDSRTRSWYTDAVKKNGQINLSNAYTTSAGEMVIVVSKEVKDLNGALRGVVSIDADLSNLSSLISGEEDVELKKTVIILVDNTGAILVNKNNPDTLFKKIQEIGIKGLEKYTPGDEITFTETISGSPCDIRTVKSQNKSIPLNYIMLIPHVELKASHKTIASTMLIVIITGFMLSVIVAILFGNFIGRPLLRITSILKNISEGDGDLTERLPVLSNDEIGLLSGYFNKMMEKISASLISVIQESVKMQEVSQSLSGGMTETAGAITEISSNVSSIKHQIQNQSAGVEETAATMKQISLNITKLSENIDSQAASVVQSSSSIEEMVANIRSVTSILEKNSVSVTELSNSAETGRSFVAQTVELTNKISTDSEGLLEASNIIQNIASQTNLLAMNAAIEAAHAGTAGKGFAVVADEIRKLAEDSNKQGKKISEVLESLRKLIVTVTDGIANTQKQFDVIFNNTKTVFEQEQVIKNAMDEQSSGGQQVLESIHRINSITADVKNGAENMQEGGKEILTEMDKLSAVTLEINNGIGEITAGVNDISNTMQNINERTIQNNESISRVTDELNKFKV